MTAKQKSKKHKNKLSLRKDNRHLVAPNHNHIFIHSSWHNGLVVKWNGKKGRKSDRTYPYLKDLAKLIPWICKTIQNLAVK